MDTIKCFEGINYKDLLEKFFGKINYNLVFYPNILLPQLFSSGASSPKELYCIARMPGPVYLNENLLKFSEDSVWVNIVAFHEFCHPLLDFVFRNKKEDIIRSKEIGSKLAVFDLYKEHYPMWEDLFSELLIYSMTIVFLRQNISLVEAEKFTKESEDKTGIKLYSKTADLLEEYLVLNHQGKYKTINEYFGILVEKLIN